ncbi:FMN-dependent dehydrogenase [Oceanospirillum multiglobuliferum]|uniref:Alpha-hydroxy-acid oxidizing enzyme n=1 Tax=Oceanospirillum multiglobuliferum TaxID=64969 RepID=A0A1T4NAX7_9GAMM|nr:alpha-hydroxy acid oxidase [Oceanospirillum multiglobuliferum]OPX55902.1 alpha-hydroxy-acid oxidizing enzyme [Oceanospirillum multiglobuliferum]SJZ76384.1 FMN-dependent dehydrogenase [Oceanospirillum multiglobuliferum]
MNTVLYPTPPLSHLPQDLVSVADYQRYAQKHLPKSVFEYITGGGADEITLQRNRLAFQQWSILPRVLRDITDATTATNLCGQAFRHPILLAPVAFHQLVHPDGELATAEAASLLDTGMVVSTLSSQSLESVAQKLESPRWFQLYMQQNRDFTLQLVRRAEAAGYQALMVTIDAPLHGVRNRAQRAGFQLPAEIEAVNLRDRPPLPRAEFTPDQSVIFQGMMSEAPTWRDIEWLRTQTKLPIILKGILHSDDLRIALNVGVEGAVISNHGGRTLDQLPTALEMLPELRASLNKADFTLLVDGGIERGTDIFTALALGADAVMIGRPQLYALGVAGKLGIAHLLRTLRDELEITMALAGCSSIEQIDAQYLRKQF